MASNSRSRWFERARPHVVACLRFGLCASAAWFATLLCELVYFPNLVSRTPARLGYSSLLALGYSALCLPLLGAAHALRQLLRTRVRRADVALCVLLGLALLAPSSHRAELLTGGSGLLDSPYELPLQVGLTLLGCTAYVAVWVVHLALCSRRRARLTPLWFAPGVLALGVFAHAVNSRLQVYNFVASFVMPGAWLFAASLWYGFVLRSRRQAAWTALTALIVLGCAAYGVANPSAVHHAQAEFQRRAGLAAVCEAASQFAPRPAYANLAPEPPARLACPVHRPTLPADTLGIARERRRNAILISIDALRKDALGREVGGRPLTPALDRFAARSLSFRRAITPYPATLFALGAVVSGLYPSEILLAPESLRDVLQLTAASWDRRAVIWPDAVWFRRSGLPPLLARLPAQLVDGAERQTDALISELREARAAEQRVFAWVHYYEPHQSLSREARERFGVGSRARYDALVAEVDVQLGRLFRELETLGYLDDSLILVFGDHGEALGELGYYGHHLYLNQFLSDVPLLLHAPGVAAGTSDRLASLTDVAPTLLDWTRTPAIPNGEARSLFELATSQDERYALSEAFPVRGRLLFELVREPIATLAALEERLALVRSGSLDYQPKVSLVGARERLIVNRVTGDRELYARDADPYEREDLSQRELPAEARLRAALAEAIQRMSQRIFCRAAKPESG
ncbi:MAG TPA: sulfatase [Polyangiales bacterium]|nr:sulfatase [Polyangiales bacterium]